MQELRGGLRIPQCERLAGRVVTLAALSVLDQFGSDAPTTCMYIRLHDLSWVNLQQVQRHQSR